MKFNNVPVPEGINVSRHSPLADLFILGLGVIAILGLLGAGLYFFGGTAARYTPYSWEATLFASLAEGMEDLDTGEAGETAPAGLVEAEAALQALADRLAARMELPEGMAVRVHYLDSDQINAFATLGGRIFVLRGLVKRMPDENALAMVLAHEIAHLANRDPAAALGGGILLQLMLSAVLGEVPAGLQGVIAGENALVLKAFGRDAERLADRDALAAVAALYGHVGGAGRIFEVFLEEWDKAGGEGPALLSTHPLSRERIAAIEALAEAEGWSLEGERTLLPEALREPADAPSASPD